MIEKILLPLHNNIINFILSLNIKNIIELAIITVIMLAFYRTCIRHSQAEKLVKGLLFIVCAWIFSEILGLLNLNILGMFLKSIITLISLSLIVIFQPELRKFLGYLGQPGYLGKTLFGFKNHQTIQDEEINIIKEIIEAVKYLTKTKTGALIVFQDEFSPSMYTEVGTKLNANISTELLLTIFHTNTPLHDGAVVIKGAKILYAGVLLPLTEDPKLSWKYGTRHRAAIGMSEISNCACLVVSEETGDVSICMDGSLKKYEDITTLKQDLKSILGFEQNNDEDTSNKLFNFSNFNKIIKSNDKKGDKI